VSDSSPVWRASLAYRLFFDLVAVVLVGGAALPMHDGVVTFPLSGGYGEGLGYRLLALVLAAALVAWVHRARMALREGDLLLRYAFWSRRIPVAEITDVTAGREGLAIETREGTTFNSPFFIGQKAPVTTWLHRRSRADAMAEEILAARPQR
jgi:hypothetical protein